MVNSNREKTLGSRSRKTRKYKALRFIFISSEKFPLNADVLECKKNCVYKRCKKSQMLRLISPSEGNENYIFLSGYTNLRLLFAIIIRKV